MMAECGFDTPPPPAANPAAPPSSSASLISTLPPPPALLAPEEPSSSPSSFPASTRAPVVVVETPPTRPPQPPASPTPDRSITPVTVFETPSFRTLPSLVLPNDFPPARSDVKSGGGVSLVKGGSCWLERMSLLGRVHVVTVFLMLVFVSFWVRWLFSFFFFFLLSPFGSLHKIPSSPPILRHGLGM